MIKFGQSCDPVYLAHVQGVGENQPTRIKLERREGKVEDLKVPSDAHAQEEFGVDQHLVPLDTDPATAGAARVRTTK